MIPLTINTVPEIGPGRKTAPNLVLRAAIKIKAPESQVGLDQGDYSSAEISGEHQFAATRFPVRRYEV